MNYPQFNHIDPKEIQPNLQKLLAENSEALENSDLNNPIDLTEALDNRLQLFWSPIQHLHSVKSSPALRKAYQTCLPLLSDYETRLSHHTKLYHAFLNAPQNRVTELALRDFKLAGIDLSSEKKKRYTEIDTALSTLSAQFGENVLKATQDWTYHADITELTGIPANLLPDNNILTLDYPSYSAVQKYAENRSLREKCYRAYVSRAPENREIIQKIIVLRQELATLLQFTHYAELSLSTKMAENSQTVLDFLYTLADAGKPVAEKEWQDLTHFAGVELSPWDISFYSDRYQAKYYAINEEALRPYFPAEHVITGLFKLVKTIFNLDIIELDPCENTIDIWHPDVKVFKITHDNLDSIFYLDLYARKNKKEGAWMDDYCSRDQDQIPIAFLTCNFKKPNPGEPGLLTHDDVITLFHEFGHGLHHLLTKIKPISISGINNTPWDAVELPSQFMENFCWDKKILKTLLSNHYQTNTPLPDDLIEKLIHSRHFHAGLQLMRQLQFGLFDFELHLSEFSPLSSLDTILKKIRAKTSVYPVPDYNHFENTFSHIFDGSYGAGYYSYLWAEVLSCDVFSLFEENGVLDPHTGQHFINTLLSQGASQPIRILFKNFRGRDPDNTAFLKSWGLC